MEFDLRNKLSRRKRQRMLNDDIFELSQNDRDDSISPDIEKMCKLTKTITNDYALHQSERSLDSCEEGEIHNENEIQKAQVAEPIDQQIKLEPPLFHIMCKNKDTLNTYEDELKNFLIDLVKLKTGKELCDSDLVIESQKEKDQDTNAFVHEKKVEIDNCEELFDVPDGGCKIPEPEVLAAEPLFIVDTDSKTPRNSCEIPLYDQLKNEIGFKPKEPVNKNKIPNSCFNCEGDHSLRDCPNSKDYNKINEARRQFASKANSYKVSRYHCEQEDKYSHFKPGRISENLRRALRLHKNELPTYIYRMRTLGYPPGWLEEARVSTSGLVIITDENSVDESVPKETFNMEKIIDYPGFNVSAGSKTRDEYKYFGCPPQQHFQSKELMIQYLTSLSEEQKKVNTVEKPVDANASSTDMEVEEDNTHAAHPSTVSLQYDQVQHLSCQQTFGPFLPIGTFPPLSEIPPPPPEIPPPLPRSPSPPYSELPPPPPGISPSPSSELPPPPPGISPSPPFENPPGTSPQKLTKIAPPPPPEIPPLPPNEIPLPPPSKNLSPSSVEIPVLPVSEIPFPNEIPLPPQPENKLPLPPTTKNMSVILTRISTDSVGIYDVENSPIQHECCSEQSNSETIKTPLESPLDISDNIDTLSFTESSQDLSLSLAELELKKQQLLLELQESNCTSDTIQESECSQNIEDLTETETLDSTENICEKNDTSKNDTLNDHIKADDSSSKSGAENESDSSVTTSNKYLGRSKSLSHVTPILSSATPNTKLPEQSKFSKDMCPVIKSNLPKGDDSNSKSGAENESDSSINKTTPNQYLGRSKSFSRGTPILSSASPYTKLPEQSKFSKDICPVINFENLPNSTGKYTQMSSLIKRVRQAVKKISDKK